MKLYTRLQVAALSTTAEPLVIIKGKVYSLAPFLDSHPGGDEIILEYHGKDISDVLKGEDHSNPDADFMLHDHSESAYIAAEEFYVGDLVVGDGGDISIEDTLYNEKPYSSTTDILDEDNQEVFLSSMQSNPLSKSIVDDERKKLFHIDFSKAIFPQLWALDLNSEQYLQFIHTPHHIPHCAIFFGNILEPFTRNPWYVVPIFWLPFVVYLWSSEAFRGVDIDLFHFCVATIVFSLGVMTWTLMEYSLHRFLFHFDENLPNNKIAMFVHFLFHGVHHFLPMDKMRLVFPPPLSIPIVSGFYFLFTLILGSKYGKLVLSGAVSGYVAYDMIHYFLHHGKVTRWMKEQKSKESSHLDSLEVKLGVYLASMKDQHMAHHYKNYHMGYGITNKFWDRVFGTLPDVAVGPDGLVKFD